MNGNKKYLRASLTQFIKTIDDPGAWDPIAELTVVYEMLRGGCKRKHILRFITVAGQLHAIRRNDVTPTGIETASSFVDLLEWLKGQLVEQCHSNPKR
jgi:hypothetical protein